MYFSLAVLCVVALGSLLRGQGTYLRFFPKQGRENLVIAVPEDGGNALTREYLTNTLELFQTISDISITYEVSIRCEEKGNKRLDAHLICSQ